MCATTAATIGYCTYDTTNICINIVGNNKKQIKNNKIESKTMKKFPTPAPLWLLLLNLTKWPPLKFNKLELKSGRKLQNWEEIHRNVVRKVKIIPKSVLTLY